MSVDGLARVHYFDEQYLRLADLVDEQAYHLLMRRRHNLGGHTWGIVAGLMVEKDKEGALVVQPGMAVDGYGRELILEYPYPVPVRAFSEKGSNELEVWLVYAHQLADSLPQGYAPCRPGEPKPAPRLLEIGRIELRASERDLFVDPTVDLPARRQPPGVPAADLRQTPAPNDDPARPWPVYLGLVRRIEGDPPTYSIDLQGRPYAGLVGEMVRAPSGRAWVQIGAELEGDTRRFAVFVPGPNDNIDYPPRLAIHENGEVALCGDTTLYGDLTVDGGAIEFRVGNARAVAQPWTIYHARATDSAGIDVEQLRMEMDANGAAEVVVGTFSSTANAFVPCLTIDNNCQVTVHGNLFVEGTLIGEVVDPGALAPDARSMALGALNSGMNAGLQRAATLVAEGNFNPELSSPVFTPGAAAARRTTAEELLVFARDNNLTVDLLALLRGEEASDETPDAPIEEEPTSASPADTTVIVAAADATVTVAVEPAALEHEPAPSTDATATEDEPLPAEPRQCAATTKSGERCKRTALPNSDYCFTHKPNGAD
jgi:hypothetical protein